MALSDAQARGYTERLLRSRMRILATDGFYGLLLMHMKFSLDESIDTAATDGRRICFSPAFLDELSDKELDFVMMHEILHVALQHCLRTGEKNPELFNIACDIVVNSNILRSKDMDVTAILLKNYGTAMHLTPKGDEGFQYTAEQVYALLQKKYPNFAEGGRYTLLSGGTAGVWDDHARWGSAEDMTALREEWTKHLKDACEAISIRDPSNGRGMLPLCAERLLKELTAAKTDWRMLLNEFVQEDVLDYSFAPPDRRFDGSNFFLPDLNEKICSEDGGVSDILFMVDTSGSMSDDEITAAFSEIKGAIDQFGGKLRGWLGFFDAAVTKPKPFSDEDEFRLIKPKGGGGTDFSVIFDYVFAEMEDGLPVSIIILTDGYAPFPEEKSARGIPVLWLVNNETVTPPWGRVARM